MTTFEHAMLGGNVALALGCARGQGWGLVAAAAVAGALPDWDGFSIALGGTAYSQIHRIWGHNLLVATCTGLAVGAFGYGIRLSETGRRMLLRFRPAAFEGAAQAPGCSAFALTQWIVVCTLASLIHLPADVIYSGAPGFTPWRLKLLWPFSDDGWVLPVVPWGDVIATLLFIAEMFALHRWPRRAQLLACATLLSLLAYVALRWLIGGVGFGANG